VSSSASASTATLPDPQQQQRPDEAQSSLNAQTLFTRLQSSLPPDLLTGLRDTISDSLRDAQAHRELAQVAQARVQGAALCGENCCVKQVCSYAIGSAPSAQLNTSPGATSPTMLVFDTNEPSTNFLARKRVLYPVVIDNRSSSLPLLEDMPFSVCIILSVVYDTNLLSDHVRCSPIVPHALCCKRPTEDRQYGNVSSSANKRPDSP
jgi:hypothetical protein